MTEWMDNVEMAISKVRVQDHSALVLLCRCVPARCTPRQSSRGRKTTSSHSVRTWRGQRPRGEHEGEQKQVKDMDVMMLRWLTETLETLMKERAADEQKAESAKLKQVGVG